MIRFPIWALVILSLMSMGFIGETLCYAIFNKKLKKKDKVERNENETKGEYIK